MKHKPELEFFDTMTIGEWKQVQGAAPGVKEKILSADTVTGSVTRLLRYPPSEVYDDIVLHHDFWEEVIILEGALYDVTLQKKFVKGFYACRPPQMPHGPFRVENGCLTFEVRYFE